MKPKSVYKFASEAGLPVGLYFILISICFFLSVRVPFLQTLMLPLIIAFPFFLGYLMKRMARTEPTYNRFSPLWLFGIYSVIFGSLICALFAGIYLSYIDSSFLVRYITQAIADINASPAAKDYRATVEMMQEALDSHILPSGMQFVSSMAWFTCFSGSILSLVLALILSRKSPKKSVSMFR